MDVNTQDIERIVRAVLSSMNAVAPNGAAPAGKQVAPGIFNELDDAVAAATQAQKSLKTVSMRNLVVEAIRKAGEQHARELA